MRPMKNLICIHQHEISMTNDVKFKAAKSIQVARCLTCQPHVGNARTTLEWVPLQPAVQHVTRRRLRKMARGYIAQSATLPVEQRTTDPHRRQQWSPLAPLRAGRRERCSQDPTGRGSPLMIRITTAASRPQTRIVDTGDTAVA